MTRHHDRSSIFVLIWHISPISNAFILQSLSVRARTDDFRPSTRASVCSTVSDRYMDLSSAASTRGSITSCKSKTELTFFSTLSQDFSTRTSIGVGRTELLKAGQHCRIKEVPTHF